MLVSPTEQNGELHNTGWSMQEENNNNIQRFVQCQILIFEDSIEIKGLI